MTRHYGPIGVPDKKLRGHVSDAYFLAERQHAEQVDKRGRWYLFHVLEVAAACTKHGPDAVAVALLHDFWEDGGQGDLSDFPEHIRSALDAITRMEGEDYQSYILRVHRNELARVVKLEDLRCNLVECPRDSLKARYEDAIETLSEPYREAMGTTSSPGMTEAQQFACLAMAEARRTR